MPYECSTQLPTVISNTVLPWNGSFSLQFLSCCHLDDAKQASTINVTFRERRAQVVHKCLVLSLLKPFLNSILSSLFKWSPETFLTKWNGKPNVWIICKCISMRNSGEYSCGFYLIELVLLDSFYPDGKSRKGVSASWCSCVHLVLGAAVTQYKISTNSSSPECSRNKHSSSLFVTPKALLQVSLSPKDTSRLSKIVLTQNPLQHSGRLGTGDLLIVSPQSWLSLCLRKCRSIFITDICERKQWFSAWQDLLTPLISLT